MTDLFKTDVAQLTELVQLALPDLVVRDLNGCLEHARLAQSGRPTSSKGIFQMAEWAVCLNGA